MDGLKIPGSTAEHEWLNQMIGEWKMEGAADAGPDNPCMESTGTEIVSSLGGLWIIGEGEGTMPGGGTAKMRITLGYDSAKQKFIGVWVGSMMTSLWVYEGELDAGRTKLTLNTEGPGFKDGIISSYQDIIEMKSPDHRTLTSQVQQADGSWTQFMKADYYRTK